MSADTATTEIWTYGGKWVSKDRLRDRWVDPEGKDLVYAKLSAEVVGGLYEVKVDRGNGNLTVYGTPIYQRERTSDHQLLMRLIVENSSQLAQHKNIRREKRDGVENPFEDALAPLIQYAKSCSTRRDKDALVAHIIRRMYETW